LTTRPLLCRVAPPVSSSPSLVLNGHAACQPHRSRLLTGALPQFLSPRGAELSWPPSFLPLPWHPLKGRRSPPVPHFPVPHLPPLITLLRHRGPSITSCPSTVAGEPSPRWNHAKRRCQPPPFGELLPRCLLFLDWTVPNPLLLPPEL
jgi:hypothetical protein